MSANIGDWTMLFIRYDQKRQGCVYLNRDGSFIFIPDSLF